MPDGSRQAGTALYVGRANKWCILEFVPWIGRTLCSSAQKDHQFIEKANFSQQTNVGPEQLSESLSLPDPFLSLTTVQKACVRPFLYPVMVQECFPSELSISNKKEEGTMFGGLHLSRIKWIQKYAFYDGIKVAPLDIDFYEIAWESCMLAMLL